MVAFFVGRESQETTWKSIGFSFCTYQLHCITVFLTLLNSHNIIFELKHATHAIYSAFMFTMFGRMPFYGIAKVHAWSEMGPRFDSVS